MRLALTGGATGIGAATVARLRADGHEIVVFDIQKPEGDERWIKLDLMDEGSISIWTILALGENLAKSPVTRSSNLAPIAIMTSHSYIAIFDS